MRPAKMPQSALRAPLNWILATEGNVRVLRVLFLAGEPLSRSDVASRAGLSLPGTSSVLEKLGTAGIVRSVGTGSRQSVGIRAEHPLSALLGSLFDAEAMRPEALADEMRGLLGELRADVLAAWLEESGTEERDPRAPVRLGVLVGAREVAATAAALEERVGSLQKRYDVAVLVRVVTRADLETLEPAAVDTLREAAPVLGPHPLDLAGTGEAPTAPAVGAGRSSHAEADRRSLARARWVAARLDHDPTLPRRARTWVVHRLHRASAREGHDLAEWLRLLETAAIPRIQYALVDGSEHSDRLRQSNPFLPVLTDEEREAMEEATRR